MNFMRIIVQGPGHAFFNMALDEALSEAVRQRLSPPTLRLYQWERPSLSIGYFQKISDIDACYCEKMGYPVVRRETGGRAILHDSELTYSLSSPADFSLFNGNLFEDYLLISNAMILALKLNGINAVASFRRKRNSGHKTPSCFKSVSYGEITVEGKKVIGSAQKRYRDGFLQHGSIVMGFNEGELLRVLGYSDKYDFRDIGALKDYAPDISFSTLVHSLKEALEKTLKIKMIQDRPTAYELDLARELQQSKYSASEWNHRR